MGQTRRTRHGAAPPARALLLAACVAGMAGVAGVASALPAAASAQLLEVKVPSVSVSVPGVGSETVGVEVSGAGVGVSGTGVSASTPSVSASAPGVSASAPSVSVSASGVGTSSPGVSVSSGEAGASAPGTGSSSAPGAGESGGSTPGAGESGGSQKPVGTGGSAPAGGGHGSSSAGASSSGASSASTPQASGQASAASPDASAAGDAPSAAGEQLADPAARRSDPVRSRAHAGRTARRTGGRPGAPATGAVHAPAHPAGLVAAAGKDRAASGSSHSNRTNDPLSSIGAHIPLPLPVPDWSRPIILALALLALAMGLRARLAGVRARRLEGQRSALLSDLDAMQAALVPAVPARVGGLALSVAYRPADGPAAGGDFYDVFETERGRVAIILGDVAGHGRRALTQAALTRYTLRAYVQAGLEPRAALALTGRVLADPTAEHYATVVVACYDMRSGLLTYASAGHPAPIVLGLQPRDPLAIHASPPVGWDVPTGRRQTTLSLPAGAVACFFSDGLVESRCEGGLLGAERLAGMLAGLGPRPRASELLERVRAAASATPDDMAACIVTAELAPAAPAVHIEEIEADADALGGRSLPRMLASAGLSPEQVAGTLGRARAIAAASGTALLRVDLSTSEPAVLVARCSPPAAPAAQPARARVPA